jgi:polysaccharide lyase-like protein
MRSPRSTVALVSLFVAALTALAGFTAVAAAHPGSGGKGKRARGTVAREGIAPQRALGVGRPVRGHRSQSASDPQQATAARAAQAAKVPSTSQPTSAKPSPALAPGVLFRGAQPSDFWVAQSAPGAITTAPDPAGSGENVIQMTVGDNDGYPVTPTENPRAELISPNNIVSGQELWWSAKFFLPAEFPSSTPNFVTLLQGPYGPPYRGTPPFHIEVNGSVIKWQRNSTYNWDIPWEMPLVRNQWVSVMVHEMFGPQGWIELWVNGEPITFFDHSSYNPNHVAPTQHLAMQTMDSSNNGAPNSIYLQQYRKKGMFSSLTIFQGPLTIGTSREAVGG